MITLGCVLIGSVLMGILCWPIVHDVVNGVELHPLERAVGILGMMAATILGGWSLIIIIAVSLAKAVT